MINIRLNEWKLRNKILLHVAAIGTLTATFITLLYIKTQRNIIYQMSRQKAELVSSIIENGIFASMGEGRTEKVHSVLSDISSPRSIKKIRILDTQGRILKSTQEEEIGLLVEDWALNKLSNHLYKKSTWSFVFLKPESTISDFRTIENRRECFGCHPSSERITGILEVNFDYAETAALLKRSQTTGYVAALIAMAVLTWIILRLFEKLINHPISQLKDKMKRVQNGDLNIQFSPAKADEIGSLGISFNTMICKLNEANRKIEKLHNMQMERAGHLASLGELAAGLAHEIKNPIAGMKGALEIINQRTEESDPKKEIFTEIIYQIEKINKVIQDLLSYAKPKEMSMSLISPNECVQYAIKLANTQINGKTIRFHFEGLEENILAYMDSDKIQEVMLNLMLNSISAIEREGNITIRLRAATTEELEIVFSDDGIGIPQENLPQIFNPFFTTKTHGTGLGLSICKKIIEAHNGSIDVKSQANEGTTFVIRLRVLGQKPSSCA